MTINLTNNNTRASSAIPLSRDLFAERVTSVWEKSLHEGILPLSSSIQRQLREGVTPPCIRAKTDRPLAVIERQRAKAEKKLREKVDNKKSDIISSLFDMYTNSFEANLPLMVIGNEALRRSAKEMANFGVLSEAGPATSIRVPQTHRGSILCDKKWSVIKNDAYILGAIHSYKTFYVWSNKSTPFNESDLWDTENNRPRLMGREIAMIRSAGYEQVSPKNLIHRFGLTFVCIDKDKARNATFESLQTAVRKIKSLEKMIRLVS